MSRRTPLFTIALLVVALVAVSVVAVGATGRAAAERERVAELRAEVVALEARVRALEADPAEGDRDGDDGDPLADLFGDGGVGDALERLLGGVGGELPGLRCLTPDGGEGGLGGLLDGLGGLLREGGDEGGGGGGDEGGGGGGDEPEQVVAEVTAQVADLRELEPTGEVEVAFLDDAEVTAELETLLERDLDLDDLDARTEALVALRAVPTGTDLAALQRELLTGQVAGFYVPEEGRLVVRVPEGAIRPLDRITLAHELVHAIVDQRLGLPDLADDVDADAALARLAVIEGDATLLMNRWSLEHLSFADQFGLLGAGDLVAQQEQLEAVPYHLARELLFPYTAGLDLVCDRWLDGGWSAVDAAYDDLPTTTAEVLFGGEAADPPAPPPPLDPPPGGRERLTDTFGAAPLLWLFEAPGGDTEVALDDPTGRAAAWAGGQVQVWEVAGGPVVGLALAERDGTDLDLCASVTDWYGAASPGADRDEVDGRTTFTDPASVAVVRCDDAGVRLAVAGDATVAAAVVGGP
jgi:hypothetical protein